MARHRIILGSSTDMKGIEPPKTDITNNTINDKEKEDNKTDRK